MGLPAISLGALELHCSGRVWLAATDRIGTVRLTVCITEGMVQNMMEWPCTVNHQPTLATQNTYMPAIVWLALGTVENISLSGDRVIKDTPNTPLP